MVRLLRSKFLESGVVLRLKKLSKLFPITYLFLSQKVSAALLCGQVFATSDLSLFKGYFAVEKRIEKNLIMRHETLASQKLIDSGDSLSQSGLPKPMGMELYVQFPQDKGKYTKIITYGRPYLENGQVFIDFKIWDRDWGSERLLHDRDSKILRRMTLEQFLEIGKSNFISHLKYLRKMVFIKTSTDGYEIWFPKEFNDSRSTVIAVSPRGEERTFDYLDIANWNLGLSKSEENIFKQFIQLKGLGSVHFVPAQIQLTKIEPERSYLLVEKLPSIESQTIPLFSSNIKEQLNQVLANKFVLLLTGEASGIHAAVTRKFPGLNLKNPILIVTPTTHKYVIAHEMQHLLDMRQNILSELIETFTSQFPTGQIGISEITFGRFYTLILEQRAYQTQFEAMKLDAGLIEKITVETSFGTKELDFANFMEKEYKHQTVFKENYIDPIREDFKTLKKENISAWQFFLRIAKKYSLPSEDFSILALFE